MYDKKRNWAHINAYVYIDRDDEVYNRQVNKWINKCFVIYNIMLCLQRTRWISHVSSASPLSSVLFATT